MLLKKSKTKRIKLHICGIFDFYESKPLKKIFYQHFKFSIICWSSGYENNLYDDINFKEI